MFAQGGDFDKKMLQISRLPPIVKRHLLNRKIGHIA
jgi:hypothetical protein